MKEEQMAKDQTLRRGEPETRSNFDRAKDDYDNATGDTRVTGGVDACPTCGSVMTLTRFYKGEQSYRFTGACSNDPEHNLERFGYYSTETGT